MFSVPDLGENNAAKQYVPGKPRLVNATVHSVINKALSQTQAKTE